MANIVLERHFDPAIGVPDVVAMAKSSFECMGIYGLDWQQSFLAADGKKMFCHFIAPDAEAVRNTVRQGGSDYEDIWPGSVIEAGTESMINVMVERRFEAPVEFEDIAAIEEKGAWCLQAHNVTFVRTLFSDDRKRMLCLYQAPDAESVRMSQQKAEMPIDTVWSCQHLTPETLSF